MEKETKIINWEQVFFLLGDIKAKVEREDIFKPTIEYGSLQYDSNGNGVRIVNIASSST
jgi:hypothetical protein